ncbi:MAG TPA: UPF0182 family protein, partial [Streptosporangiaceae bacterium]
RYTINGKTQDYVVGARELVSAELTGNQQNWINRHLVYTHGNGFVAAAANQDLRSQSDFTEGGVPPEGPLKIEQPGIYYGEKITDYSIVGARAGEQPREFDRPAGAAEEKSTYAGSGGVNIGSPLRRLAFAIYYRERNILLSGAINPSSKIIFVRDPAERVQKVAPFLKVDEDPYPAVVDGRIVWILDGYTTLNGYPYAQHETLGEAAADSLTGQPGGRRLANQEINYIRNSVKATVDAYNGTVTLYEWDSNDPLLKTWERVYPGIMQPKSKVTADLQAHFRYPEDMFKVQRKLLTKYHVTDPVAFFNTQDFWAVPSDPTKEGAGDQPPYYILAQAPGQARPTFQLTSALNALNRPNLAAYVTVSSDPQDYGTLRVLELPGTQAVLGPVQVFGKFNATPEISQTRTLLGQGGSHVIFGNLLTLPVAGGLLYVEPMYVEANTAPYPLLQKILVAFGSNVAIGDTLQQALDKLFGPGAGGQAPVQTAPPGSATATTSPGSPPATGPAPPPLAQAVRDIQEAIAHLKDAYRTGNLAAIGQAQEELQRAVDAFEKASTATATPSAAGSPTATP